jgi:ComF family protein
MTGFSFRELSEGLAHLFYPLLCEGCRKQLVATERVLCTGCETELALTNYHTMPGNETEIRFSGRFPFEKATSFAWFTEDGLLQHMLHGLKYRDRQEIGIWLGARFGCQLATCNWQLGIDAIVPVPLHRSKEALRGYNQSEVIARGMANEMAIPIWADALLRMRATESQTSKSRTERAANVAGAFIAGKHLPLAGKHLLVVDDVLTTGATTEACALALLNMDNVKISIATIGIAV